MKMLKIKGFTLFCSKSVEQTKNTRFIELWLSGDVEIKVGAGK